MARPKGDNPNNLWNVGFELAEIYYLENKHLLVPHNYCIQGYRLGRWIGTQRYEYKKRNNPYFTQERFDKLEAVGMIWDVKKAIWQDMLQELERYYHKNGTARVPQSFVTLEGKKLGNWLNKQRLDYRSGKLLLERQDAMQEFNIIWNPEHIRRQTWDIYFELLIQYIHEYNGCLPSTGYITTNGVKLGIWLSNQRHHYNNGTLLPKRKSQLESIGFIVDVQAQNWLIYYKQAVSYYEEYGHLCPMNHRGNTTISESLLSWLSRQRDAYHKGTIAIHKIEQLEAVGMVWDVRAYIWEQNYKQAVDYYMRYGNLRISRNPNKSENSQLGEWLSTQRANYRIQTNPELTKERILKLESIGMVWEVRVVTEELWEKWFKKATVFFLENGHLLPQKGRLRTWILAQRSAKRGKRGILGLDQINRLESIGMIWEPKEEQWQNMYRRAQEYYSIHQILNIPNSYVSSDGAKLGHWIARQRRGRRNLLCGRHGGGRCVITPEHIELLNRIGMIWNGDMITSNTSQPEKAILYYLKQVYSDANKLSQWYSLGVELDIYIPSINTAVEYDGIIWHSGKLEKDEEKGRVCKENGIRLIRIRERGLPPVKDCDLCIQLKENSNDALVNTIIHVFKYLKLPTPDCDISRDCAIINKTYKDFVSRKWDKAYEMAYQYFEQHGNLSFPENTQNNAGINLTYWLGTQRTSYKNNQLTPLQIRKLELIGIVWDSFETKWLDMFQLANGYNSTHQSLMIPAGYHTKNGVALGSWLSTQREAYRKGNLTPRRVFLLESLGIIWNPWNNKYDQFVNAAKIYKRKYGHIHIPAQHITQDGIRLGEWLCDQREKYHAGKLSHKQIEVLEALGVQWCVFSERWEEMFTVARDYFKQYGHLWISPNYIVQENIRLGGWISQQRNKLHSKRGSSPLTSVQKQKLDSIGMVWDPYTVKWMAKYQIAKDFYLENGHLQIPVDYITEKGEKLGMWLSSQRQAMRGNPNFLMTDERMDLLNEIGMEWTLKRTSPTARHRTKKERLPACSGVI